MTDDPPSNLKLNWTIYPQTNHLEMAINATQLHLCGIAADNLPILKLFEVNGFRIKEWSSPCSQSIVILTLGNKCQDVVCRPSI